MEGAEARGPPRIKDIMLADAQVGGAPGRGLAVGRGPGPLRSRPLAASLFLCLWLLRSPPPLSPAASSRAQWETDDTAEYVSSAPLPPRAAASALPAGGPCSAVTPSPARLL